MRGIRDEEVLGLDPDRYAAMDTDEVNAFLFERDAGMSLDDARTAFGRTYAEVVALVEATDGSVLAAPYAGDADDVLMDSIAGDTFEHYDEHLELLIPLAER
jgi:hypothetical protein